MIYKGYTIFVDVDVNNQWDIEEENGQVRLTGFRDAGDADEMNIVDYQIEDAESETPEWADDFYDTLESAKAEIDRNTK